MRLFILLMLMIASGNTKYLLVDVDNEDYQTQKDENFVDDGNSDSNDDHAQDYSIFDPLDRATVQCPPGQIRGSSGSRCYPARKPAINVRESILTARKGPLVKAQVQEIGRSAGTARRTGRSLG